MFTSYTHVFNLWFSNFFKQQTHRKFKYYATKLFCSMLVIHTPPPKWKVILYPRGCALNIRPKYKYHCTKQKHNEYNTRTENLEQKFQNKIFKSFKNLKIINRENSTVRGANLLATGSHLQMLGINDKSEGSLRIVLRFYVKLTEFVQILKVQFTTANVMVEILNVKQTTQTHCN